MRKVRPQTINSFLKCCELGLADCKGQALFFSLMFSIWDKKLPAVMLEAACYCPEGFVSNPCGCDSTKPAGTQSHVALGETSPFQITDPSRS